MIKALKPCYNNVFTSVDDRFLRKRYCNLSTGPKGVMLAEMSQQVRVHPREDTTRATVTSTYKSQLSAVLGGSFSGTYHLVHIEPNV